MSDRELLEAAAKAIGLDADYFPGGHGYEEGMWFDSENDCRTFWNPLTDDGDALRLAVKMVHCTGIVRRPRLGENYAYAGKYGEVHENIAGDPCAATRRAIVRAAAALAG